MHKCPSCLRNEFVIYRHINGYDLSLCRNCCLLSTIVKEDDRKSYLKKQYGSSYAHGYSNNLSKMQGRYKKYLKLINLYSKGGKFLDIGCGTGYFLKFVKDFESYWDLYGVEPNNALREIASNNSDLNIKKGDLSGIPFGDKYFDVVTCNDVLEHSNKLKLNLKELHRVLKDNGVLLIQSPNYKSFMAYLTGNKWDWWSVPDHVLHFSHSFLIKLFQENGFTILNSYTYDDQEDFLSNIKGVMKRNYLTKYLYILILPILILIERFGWATNRGGLSLLLVRKNLL